MRTFEDIQDLQQSYFDTDIETMVTNLPPGYVEGFKLTLGSDYKVTIGGGTTTVGGNRVSTTERDLSGDDWISSKVGGADTGTFFYLYLTINAEYRVDRSAPVYTDDYYYYAHPTLGYRVIGKLWLDTDNDIKYVTSEFTDTAKAEVTVAANGYIGDADYYCTGIDDQIMIQVAIDYIATAYVGKGGAVSLLFGEEAFKTTASIVLKASVSFIGNQATIERGHDDDTFNATGSDGSEIRNIKIRDVFFTYTGSTQATTYIDLDYCDNVEVSGCEFTGYGVTRVLTVDFRNCTRIYVAANTNPDTSFMRFWTCTGTVESNDFSGACANAILITSSPGLICQNNTMHDIYITASIVPTMIYSITSDRVTIVNNTINDLHSAKSAAYGIHISGDDCIVNGNTVNGIDDYDNTTDKFAGILIAAGSERTQVSNNICTNNGNLIDRANCESTTAPSVEAAGDTLNATSDARSDTQAYEGTYSWKTVGDGVGALRIYPHDSSADLHSLVPGIEYTLEMYVYNPAGGYTKGNIKLFYDDDVAAETYSSVLSADDTWEKLTLTFTVDAAATVLDFGLLVDETGTDTIYRDNIRLFQVGVGNEHQTNFLDAGTDTHQSGNSWQQPVAGEPSGGTWHKYDDPATGTIASKTTGWTADSFSGGLEVDFSSVKREGMRAVRVRVRMQDPGESPIIFYRKDGDTNVSNGPIAGSEFSHELFRMVAETNHSEQVVLWLSNDYKAQIAVRYTTADVYIAYPIEYLL